MKFGGREKSKEIYKNTQHEKAKERYWKLGGRETAKQRYESMRRGKARSMDKMVDVGPKVSDKQACEDGDASGSPECCDGVKFLI